MGPRQSKNAKEPHPGFPVPNGTVSYWQARYRSSPLFSINRDSPLPSTADAVIIGSGITGAVCAYNLLTSKDPPGQIVLLEAREICSGATGRNGGHLRPDMFLGFEEYSEIVGQEQAHKVLKNELETLEYIKDLVDTEDIDCDFWQGETLEVFMTDTIKKAGRSSYDAYKRYGGLDGERVAWVEDPSEAAAISRVIGCVGLAKWPAASLYPLKFVHGLLQKCVQKGLQLYSHALVEQIERQGNAWRVTTPRGEVVAGQVVLATNAYTNAIAPVFHSCLVPCKEHCSSVVPTAPYSGPARKSGTAEEGMLKYTMSITWGGHDFEYLVPRQHGDGAWILGGAKRVLSDEERTRETTDDSFTSEAIRKRLANYGKDYFHDWGEEAPGEGLERSHSGIIAHTRDTLPIIGEVPLEDMAGGEMHETGQDRPSGLFVCAGWQGHGMARCATGARGISRLLLASRAGENTLKLDDAAWEELSELPSCFRWSSGKKARSANLPFHAYR